MNVFDIINMFWTQESTCWDMSGYLQPLFPESNPGALQRRVFRRGIGCAHDVYIPLRSPFQVVKKVNSALFEDKIWCEGGLVFGSVASGWFQAKEVMIVMSSVWWLKKKLLGRKIGGTQVQHGCLSQSSFWKVLVLLQIPTKWPVRQTSFVRAPCQVFWDFANGNRVNGDVLKTCCMLPKISWYRHIHIQIPLWNISTQMSYLPPQNGPRNGQAAWDVRNFGEGYVLNSSGCWCLRTIMLILMFTIYKCSRFFCS